MTDQAQETQDPTPPLRVGRLNSLRKVRRELARLYVDLRNKRVDAKVAGTGAYILTAITKTLEVELLEARIEALEERAVAITEGNRTVQSSRRKPTWSGHA